MRRRLHSKSDTCPESFGCRCGGHKREGESALPGEVCNFAVRLLSSRGEGMKLQKSAEGIVGSFDRTEGLNMKERTRDSSFDEQQRRRK